MKPIVRETTQQERVTWGECRVCGAQHGEYCRPEAGILLGHPMSQEALEGGVHFARLQDAPLRVRIEGIG